MDNIDGLKEQLEIAKDTISKIVEATGKACDLAYRNNAIQGREYLVSLLDDMQQILRKYVTATDKLLAAEEKK